jgi:hypothetical protein
MHMITLKDFMFFMTMVITSTLIIIFSLCFWSQGSARHYSAEYLLARYEGILITWIYFYHFPDKAFGIVTDGCPLFSVEVVLALGDLLEDLLVRGSWEGGISAEEDVEDHSTRPNITFLVVLFFQNFWGYIVGLML